MAIYGIDLGTTNSLIGLHSANWISDMVPSCVNIDTGEAGATMYDIMSAKRSFKVDMSMGDEGIIPRIASHYVLKELVRQVPKDMPPVEDVVISVPAYFSDMQRQATITAAEMAGLNVKALVNEPTAAAMYVARNKKGLYVIYDLGGGTFDVSIIDSRFGAFDVQATTGLIKGGDNFDKEIAKYFVKKGHIPIAVMNQTAWTALQHYATKQKVKLQKTQDTVQVDLTMFGGTTIELTPQVYKDIMYLTFSDTITCLTSIIQRWIPSDEVYDIILVGGSTHCPYLRTWIEEETGVKPAPLTYDPDFVVALGASLYADIYEQGGIGKVVSDVTKGLSISLYDGTCSIVVPPNSKVPLSMEKVFTNPVDASELELNLYQGEHMLAKDNDYIGTLRYKYDCVKAARTGQVMVTLSVDASGVITFSANELLKAPMTIVLDRSQNK